MIMKDNEQPTTEVTPPVLVSNFNPFSSVRSIAATLTPDTSSDESVVKSDFSARSEMLVNECQEL